LNTKKDFADLVVEARLLAATLTDRSLAL